MMQYEWLVLDNPAAMLAHLGSNVSARKLRLFAVACCRQPEVWSRLVDDSPCPNCDQRWGAVEKCSVCSGTGIINRSRRAVEVAERFADGLATEKERGAAWGAAHQAARNGPHPFATFCADCCGTDHQVRTAIDWFLNEIRQLEE